MLSCVAFLSLLVTLFSHRTSAQTVLSYGFEPNPTADAYSSPARFEISGSSSLISTSLREPSAALNGTFGALAAIPSFTEPGAVTLSVFDLFLTPSCNYTFSIWIKSPTTGLVQLKAVTDSAVAVQSKVAATLVWQKYQIKVFGPARSAYSFQVSFLSDNAVYWLDDLALRQFCSQDDLLGPNSALLPETQQARKNNLTVRVVDQNGIPIEVVDYLQLTQDKHQFPWGGFAQPESVRSDALDWYQNMLGSHFNALVPGNRFKWPSYEPKPNSTSAAYGTLQTWYFQGIKDRFNMSQCRGHTFDWFVPMPPFSNHWSRQHGCDSYSQFIKTRVKREVASFKGQFTAYDVWNEVLHKTGMLDNCSLWNTTFQDAFRWAAEEDDQALLCLNEYGLIDSDDWVGMINLVHQLQANSVPISCIGIQAHVTNGTVGNPHAVRFKLNQLAGTGLALHITELDYYTNATALSGSGSQIRYNYASEQEQSDAFKLLVSLFFAHPGVKGIWLWSVWDGGVATRNGGIFNNDTSPKLAATTLKNMWSQDWNSSLGRALPSSQVPGGPLLSTSAFHGDYTLTVYHRSQVSTHKFSIDPDSASTDITIQINTGSTNVPINPGDRTVWAADSSLPDWSTVQISSDIMGEGTLQEASTSETAGAAADDGAGASAGDVINDYPGGSDVSTMAFDAGDGETDAPSYDTDDGASNQS